MRRNASQGVDDRKPQLRASELLTQTVSLSVYLAALITYAGYSYYDALFRSFGLRPTILDLSPVDFSFMGFSAVLASFFKLLAEYWPLWLTELVGLLLVGAVLVFLSRQLAWARALVEKLDALHGPAGQFGFFAFGLALISTAAFSGWHFGSNDAGLIRSAAINSPLCYRSAETIHRGALIGQGPANTVIKTATTTVILTTSDIAEVADCK
jgi:hypothetical protein